MISNLPFTNDHTGRYEFDVEGNALCVVNHYRQTNTTLRFCRIRRTGLPQLEQAGRISDLDLDPDTGLLEATHVVFFSGTFAGTFAAADYNHFGPRLSRLGNYLNEKSGGAVPRATFRPLLRGDAAEQLDRLEDIRQMDIRIRPAYAEIIKQADQSLGDAFAASARVIDGAETVNLVIKAERNSRRSTLTRFLPSFRRLIGQDGLLQDALRFQVRGQCEDSGRVETIDLLKDQLISKRRFVRLNERSRALDPESAFQTIQEAIREHQDEILLAADISP